VTRDPPAKLPVKEKEEEEEEEEEKEEKEEDKDKIVKKEEGEEWPIQRHLPRQQNQQQAVGVAVEREAV
jgi:hypothetical protein